MGSESPLRRSEFLLDSLFMNSRPFSMERPLVEENPFPDRRGFTECLQQDSARPGVILKREQGLIRRAEPGKQVYIRRSPGCAFFYPAAGSGNWRNRCRDLSNVPLRRDQQESQSGLATFAGNGLKWIVFPFGANHEHNR
ncbi:MAG: hypothetical protein L3J03_08665 [Desulfobacterales bacterium]|nr:hypothetical protein [Desulfobacterales bacterium]